ncbi:energy transducer TonB [Paucibacter sp. AS339]|uniref:energy transducer TonB n=1 Tax=Paucibacter hankyongi TaxID=3133434 RepID=UPI0030B3E1D1
MSPQSGPPAAPKQIAPGAVRYLQEPKLTVPLQSRRLGETGVAHLRIVVDAQGLLKEVSLKKSSGFARLDQQALQDIRSARFMPYVENGRAIEWETTALLSYESER